MPIFQNCPDIPGFLPGYPGGAKSLRREIEFNSRPLDILFQKKNSLERFVELSAITATELDELRNVMISCGKRSQSAVSWNTSEKAEKEELRVQFWPPTKRRGINTGRASSRGRFQSFWNAGRASCSGNRTSRDAMQECRPSRRSENKNRLIRWPYHP